MEQIQQIFNISNFHIDGDNYGDIYQADTMNLNQDEEEEGDDKQF
jgi:hypothetical protein